MAEAGGPGGGPGGDGPDAEDLVRSLLDEDDAVPTPVGGLIDGLVALAVLSRELNRADDTRSVVATIVARAPEVVGSDEVGVALVDEDASRLLVTRPAAGAGPENAVGGADAGVVTTGAVGNEAGWTSSALHGGLRTPLHDAVTGRTAVHVADHDDRVRRYPHLAEEVRTAGLTASSALPLLDESGRAIGAIGIGWREAVDLDQATSARLELLTDLCRQAVERVRRTEAANALARRLQTELIGTHDDPSGLVVAVAHRPALKGLGFGGDWSDVVALDNNRTAVIVGDVAGHGVAAATQMAQAKGILRALILAAPRLGDLGPLATRSLSHLDVNAMTTAAVAVIDTRTRMLEWITLGHPPPILRRPDGGAEILWSTPQPPIGVVSHPAEPPRLALPAGSALVLFTDGLIEQRGRGIDAGLEVLRAAVERVGTGSDATALCDALLHSMDPSPTDDVALVVVAVR